MATGAEKYGVRNWRLDSILASTYIGAIFRHACLEWAEGTDVDSDSGEHPLAHVAACCLIVMDSEAHGSLIDDRLLCESKDPDDGAVKRFNPADEPDPMIEGLLLNLRRYSELVRRLVDKTMNYDEATPLTSDEFDELEELHAAFGKMRGDVTIRTRISQTAPH